jgi:hypothetical protein
VVVLYFKKLPLIWFPSTTNPPPYAVAFLVIETSLFFHKYVATIFRIWGPSAVKIKCIGRDAGRGAAYHALTLLIQVNARRTNITSNLPVFSIVRNPFAMRSLARRTSFVHTLIGVLVELICKTTLKKPDQSLRFAQRRYRPIRNTIG